MQCVVFREVLAMLEFCKIANCTITQREVIYYKLLEGEKFARTWLEIVGTHRLAG